MNHNFSLRTRTAAVSVAVLAFSVTALGPAQAMVGDPSGSSVPARTAADFASARIVVAAQAARERADLLDLRY